MTKAAERQAGETRDATRGRYDPSLGYEFEAVGDRAGWRGRDEEVDRVRGGTRRDTNSRDFHMGAVSIPTNQCKARELPRRRC